MTHTQIGVGAEWSLPMLELNQRPAKPRTTGLTEVRGPYYTMPGPRYLEDLYELAAFSIDWLKIPAPSVALVPKATLARMVESSHANDVKVTAGGLIEYVLTRGHEAVNRYFDALPDLGFDVVEVSAGMVALSDPDYMRLIERAAKTGLTVKAEVGVQFGAGGTSTADALEAEGTPSISGAITRAKRALDAGAHIILLESEGVTESVHQWRTDVPAALAAEIGLDKLMFEAAEQPVFEWYVKNFGPDVNLFIDHSQVLQLEGVRSGVWGSSQVWNRVVSYKG